MLSRPENSDNLAGPEVDAPPGRETNSSSGLRGPPLARCGYPNVGTQASRLRGGDVEWNAVGMAAPGIKRGRSQLDLEYVPYFVPSDRADDLEAA